MCPDIPPQAADDHPMRQTSWPINLSTLRSLPRWIANAATTVGALFVLFVLFLAAVAVLRLAIDLLGNDTLRASDAVRSFLPIAAAAAGLPLIIWRLVILNRQTQISDAKTQIDRETYYTTIFAKSVELMGLVRESKRATADGNEITLSVPNIESRLGALYSLERLLSESVRDQRAIIETICPYIRENSSLEIAQDETEAAHFLLTKSSPKPTRRADVQAALTIIGRRPEIIRARAEREEWRIDLRNANLMAYDFSNLNYDNARFDNSCLNAANMSGGSFIGCVFKNTGMRAANMTATIFQEADFDHCDLHGAEIEASDFSSAKFVNTDLRAAKVISFNIKGADLENAFGVSLQYSLKRLKESGPDIVSSNDVVGIHQLFRKATYDDQTNISEAARDAILIMLHSEARQTERAEAIQH